MDDLLREFLTETNENIDVVDVELVKFERDPNNAQVLDNIFRLVHTIKGTCGFLGLPRLGALAHAAETLMGKFREGAPVTTEAVGLILRTIDRVKELLVELETNLGQEPEGNDDDLIGPLEALALGSQAQPEPEPEPEPAPQRKVSVGTLTPQVLERELLPGEDSLDDIERAFREAQAEVPVPKPVAKQVPAAPAAEAKTETKAEAKSEAKPAAKPAAKPGKAGEADEGAGKGSVSSQSLRVNVDTLEKLMTMVSELVLTRNQLMEIARRQGDTEFKVPLQRLSNVTAELQEGVMKTRMQPIGNAWQKLPRIVRDLAQELNKQIDLEMVGAETELDRQILDLIKDPLTHMVRNSADHGLESTEQRRAAGKPERGKIRLAAYHEGGHIIIEISDDGRGLDTARIRAKALENGLATEAELEKMSEAQIHKFIFHAGFSTAAKVTSVSGRGVGMDVVRNNIEIIGGTIDVRSVPGRGTTFVIKIPLTLAIVSALIVEAAGDRFAIPQLAVMELVRVHHKSGHRIERIKNTPVLRLRNKLLPVVPLAELLGTAEPGSAVNETEQGEQGFIVVMQVGNQTFGIVVDAVFHTEEIVVKPMSSLLRHLSIFSGNTILGDGSVIMIIDPNGIAQAAAHSSTLSSSDSSAADAERASGKGNAVALLLFRAGGPEPKAVPLSLVTRLEELPVEKIERATGRPVVQYRGTLMPLVPVNDRVEQRESGTQPVLVFSDSGRSVGLMVDEIIDIVEEQFEITLASDVPGILGSGVVRGQTTEIIDIAHYLPMGFKDWFHRRAQQGEPQRRSLLLVDDSAFFRNMIGPALKAAGYDVTLCDSAVTALQLIEGGAMFDVVVTDIEMPHMDGFEFASRLRSDPRLEGLPIIALSGLCTPEAIERGRSVGFSDYIAKFDKPGLLEALKEFAGVQQEVAAA